MSNTGLQFERLAGIMDELRDKCPWDRKQTIQTLRSMTIEETYELTDAIIEEDWKVLRRSWVIFCCILFLLEDQG